MKPAPLLHRVIALLALACSTATTSFAAEVTSTEPDTSAGEEVAAVVVETVAVDATAGYEIPQSIFLVGAEGGRDPFFPMATDQTVTNSVPVPEDPDTLARKFIVLRGITGPVGNKVALLNNTTFKLGDTNSVRLVTGQSRLNVTVIAIEESSVRFRVEGGSEEHKKTLSE